MTAAEYPLQWPEHIKRASSREPGKFKTTLAGARGNVLDSLRRFASDSNRKLTGVVISSNVTLSTEKPTDPGVAVWFVWDNMQVCIPVDRYSSVAANLQAIHHVIEARRTELRHGTLELVKATFRGFQSLPPPDKTSKRAWWQVLDVAESCTIEEYRTAKAKAVKKVHPDLNPGIDQALIREVNEAIRQAKEHFNGR